MHLLPIAGHPKLEGFLENVRPEPVVDAIAHIRAPSQPMMVQPMKKFTAPIASRASEPRASAMMLGSQ